MLIFHLRPSANEMANTDLVTGNSFCLSMSLKICRCRQILEGFIRLLGRLVLSMLELISAIYLRLALLLGKSFVIAFQE